MRLSCAQAFFMLASSVSNIVCCRRKPSSEQTVKTALTTLIALAVPAMLIATPVRAAGPSFDCNQATAADEIAICSNSQLSELDNLMTEGFQFLKLRHGRKQANAIAKPLLSLRQACGSDADCIMQRQADAIETFRKLGAPVRLPGWMAGAAKNIGNGGGMPTKVGACSESSIKFIGGRLEGDQSFDTGTAVGYDNGGTQITYDKDWGVIRSKVGDPVRICLVSVPKDCPPGDDRGKVYKTTNLRSGESWELPDSQHMCGGA
jgi:hypothetical protein